MALYEYFCSTCQKSFEQITGLNDPDRGLCPQCHDRNTERLISRFSISGRGDVREKTLDGCHDTGMDWLPKK